MNKNRILTALTLAAGLLASPAFAATDFSLTTTAGSNVTSIQSSDWGNTRTFTGSGVSANVNAYSGTGGTSTDANLMTIQSAYLSVWSGGLGVVNRDGGGRTASDAYDSLAYEPEHAMDNDQRNDVIMFSFTDQVALNSLRLGYTNTDSDLFVLAWRGTGAPVMGTLSSESFKAIANDVASNPASGWDIVKLQSDAGTTKRTFNNNANAELNVYSSYWLIGAGGFSSSTGVTRNDTTKDYVKLAAVGGVTKDLPPPPPGVPEPGSLALAGAAFLGMVGLRRRKAAA